jgi:hypothetical protein
MTGELFIDWAPSHVILIIGIGVEWCVFTLEMSTNKIVYIDKNYFVFDGKIIKENFLIIAFIDVIERRVIVYYNNSFKE